jgi:hypothetical protein
MKVTVCAAALLVVGALAGCQQTDDASQTPPPPTPQTLDKVQDAYEQQAPDMPVGRVVDVVGDVRLAAVDHVSQAQNLKEGDNVTFVDAQGHIINHGRVVRINDTFVDVRYESAGERAPRPGDLMVKVKI